MPSGYDRQVFIFKAANHSRGMEDVKFHQEVNNHLDALTIKSRLRNQGYQDISMHKVGVNRYTYVR